MPSIVYKGCGELVKARDLHELQRLEASDIVVGLSPAGVVFKAYKVTETSMEVNSKTEENLVINKNTLVFILRDVERLYVAMDDSHRTLLGRS